jgi:hypothetical protein
MGSPCAMVVVGAAPTLGVAVASRLVVRDTRRAPDAPRLQPRGQVRVSRPSPFAGWPAAAAYAVSPVSSSSSRPFASGHPFRTKRLNLVGTSHHHAPIERGAGRSAVRTRRRRAARGGVGAAACLSRPATEPSSHSPPRTRSRPSGCGRGLRRSGRRRSPVPTPLRTAPRPSPFRVAAGLDSLVPGEGEILGQVRLAHDLATTGPFLDRLFRQAPGGRWCAPRPRSVRARPRYRPPPRGAREQVRQPRGPLDRPARAAR